ncbi:hypothetical protein GALL_174120 [mine drainage metagenome]|uniref:Cytochrome c domain-containing protein n=1 Tax=mine drainage metagenome TaxID=410659 RepID=A0A1J5RXY8_9ZZZZ
MSKLIPAFAVIGAGAGAIAAFFALGLFNVSAQEKHWPMVERLIGYARDRSIETHAADIAVPENLNGHGLIMEGMSHYSAHCAMCHGAPGVKAEDMADGMYPTPPDLQKTVAQRTSAELFWIVKNGIKMSGMPSWADHGDDELWPVVAFLETLPTLKPEDYAGLMAEADRMTEGRHGHVHGDGSQNTEPMHDDMPMDMNGMHHGETLEHTHSQPRHHE